MSVGLKPQAVPRPAPKQPAPQGVPPIANTIRQAAQATGASFEYLLATAKVESNFKPELKAKTSSATGLFQFIEQTWFAMMKQAGKTLGFSRYADAITQTRGGKYQVADPGLRNEILQLRKDAAANATMAGVFTWQNATALGKRIGRVPTDGELYIAHFFGPAGASKLINAMNANPQATAAQVFPAAARANRSIFYDKQGHARTLAGVYGELNRRYQVARANTAPHAVQVAATFAPPSPAAPDTAATTQAFAVAAAQRVTPVTDNKPVFRSLFHTGGDARPAVSPFVSELWTAPVAQTELPSPAAAVTAAAAPVEPGSALDLFQEIRPNVRTLFDRSA